MTNELRKNNCYFSIFIRTRNKFGCKRVRQFINLFYFQIRYLQSFLAISNKSYQVVF